MDIKIPFVIRKPIPIDAVFKDQAKFDAQNPVISSLLTLIQISKIQKEKEIKKQLASAPSVLDLKITERLQRLSQFDRNRPLDGNDDDDDDDDNGRNNGRPLTQPPLIPSPPYSFPNTSTMTITIITTLLKHLLKE